MAGGKPGDPILRLAETMADILFVLSLFLLFVHLAAPVIGGRFLPHAVVLYGSWAGIGVLIKRNAGKIRRRERFTGADLAATLAVTVTSLFIWFPAQVAAGISALVGVLCLTAYFRTRTP